jgi:hypothetical protein
MGMQTDVQASMYRSLLMVNLPIKQQTILVELG